MGLSYSLPDDVPKCSDCGQTAKYAFYTEHIGKVATLHTDGNIDFSHTQTLGGRFWVDIGDYYCQDCYDEVMPMLLGLAK